MSMFAKKTLIAVGALVLSSLVLAALFGVWWLAPLTITTVVVGGAIYAWFDNWRRVDAGGWGQAMALYFSIIAVVVAGVAWGIYWALKAVLL